MAVTGSEAAWFREGKMEDGRINQHVFLFCAAFLDVINLKLCHNYQYYESCDSILVCNYVCVTRRTCKFMSQINDHVCI